MIGTSVEELFQQMKRLEAENLDLKELVETMQVRDVRLDKVDLMQDELEKLIITTDEDKRAWKKREEELLQMLQAKDSDM